MEVQKKGGMTKFLTSVLWLPFCLALEDGQTSLNYPNLKTNSIEFEFVYGKQTNIDCAVNDSTFQIAECDWTIAHCSQGDCIDLESFEVLQTTNECKLIIPKLEKRHEGKYTCRLTSTPDAGNTKKEITSKLTKFKLNKHFKNLTFYFL